MWRFPCPARLLILRVCQVCVVSHPDRRTGPSDIRRGPRQRTSPSDISLAALRRGSSSMAFFFFWLDSAQQERLPPHTFNLPLSHPHDLFRLILILPFTS